MSFDKGTWERTRHDCAKKSGVAKAIVEWDKSCPENLRKIPDDAPSKAADAIAQFRKALAIAKSKCDAQADADKKAKKPKNDELEKTFALIAKWDKAVDDYDKAYKAYLKTRQTEIAAEINAKNVGKLQGVIGKTFAAVPESETKIKQLLDDFLAAIRTRDIQAAYKAQTKIGKELAFLSHFTQNGFKKLVLKEQKNFPPMTFALKEVMPTGVPALQQRLGPLSKTFKSLDDQLEAVENAERDGDVGSEESPEKAKKLRELMGDFAEVMKSCDDSLKQARRLLAQVSMASAAIKTVKGNPTHGTKDFSPKSVLKQMRDAKAANEKLEHSLAESVFRVRDARGDIIIKKRNLGISDQENAKYFVPRLNKIFSKNSRVLAVIRETESQIEEIEEAAVDG